MALNLLQYITICSFAQVDLSCHRFASEPATSPSGAMVRASRMRFCQVDDTRRTLLAVHCPKVSREDRVVALTAQTILERTRLFRGLPSAAIQQISALSIRRSYRTGAIVFSQADPG